MINENNPRRLAVIGAGAWGTALARLLASKGDDVSLWFFDQAAYKQSRDRGVNPFLPGFDLKDLTLTTDLAEALTDRNLIILANPAQHNRRLLTAARSHLSPDARILNISKGIELDSFALMSEVLTQTVPDLVDQAAYLSGPSFAKEVAEEKITIVSVAAVKPAVAADWQRLLATSYFRPYLSDDIIGVQVAGAVKNVIAVAAGILAGLNEGENARAALVTRGLAEMRRLGLALGAKPETFMGAAGLGDLFLTAGSPHSRNWQFGLAVGRGQSPTTLIQSSLQVVEGYWTTKAVWQKARALGVELAITNELYQILFNHQEPRRTLENLMSRELKTEN